MKKIGHYILYFLILASNELFAKSGIFGNAVSKVDDANSDLSGPIAAGIMTLVLIIAGFGFMFNYISKGWAIAIAVGGLLIGAAPDISDWMFN